MNDINNSVGDEDKEWIVETSDIINGPIFHDRIVLRVYWLDEIYKK